LHRGIATCAFDWRFHLDDYVRVTGFSHVDGMLQIYLIRKVPAALKSQSIKVQSKALFYVEAATT